MVALLQIGFI